MAGETEGIDSEGRGRDGRFPSTFRSKLLTAGAPHSAQRRQALDLLIWCYWKPVFCYVRRCGCAEQDAKDLVQEFFAACLETNFFGQADPARGRFRNCLLGSLKHFLANRHLAAHAQRRRPPQGVVSLEDLGGVDSSRGGWEPAGGETPEAVFHCAWVADLSQRVLCRLEQEGTETGKLADYELFRQRVVLPALEGTVPPPLSELAARLGLSEKQAANWVLTGRRAYQRLLLEEIRAYAGSE